MGRAPGIRGLSGAIAGNESGGHVNIDTHAAVFTWPAQFSQPVDLETLKATLYWKRTNEQLLIATPDWEMKNRDAAVHGKAAWQQPADGSSPVLTLVSTVENGNAANTRNYLPRGVIGPQALAWLDRAFVAGHLSRADVVLRGPIRHFPFRDGSGLFLARCALDGMTLDYGDGLAARGKSGRTSGISQRGIDRALVCRDGSATCRSNRPMRVSPISRAASSRFT